MRTDRKGTCKGAAGEIRRHTNVSEAKKTEQGVFQDKRSN
jgi:hypothetical protein